MYTKPDLSRRLIVAPNVTTPDAISLIDQFAHLVAYIEITPWQLHASGAQLSNFIHQSKAKCFLGSAVCTSPKTASKIVTSMTELRVDIITVSSLGSIPMLEAAQEAATKAAAEQAKFADMSTEKYGKPLVIATLPGLDYDELVEIGVFPETFWSEPEKYAAEIAKEKEKKLLRFLLGLVSAAKKAGLDGIVVPAWMTAIVWGLRLVKEPTGSPFLIIAKGITDLAMANQAVLDGADLVIVGDAICNAPDPVAAAKEFNRVILEALITMVPGPETTLTQADFCSPPLMSPAS